MENLDLEKFNKPEWLIENSENVYGGTMPSICYTKCSGSVETDDWCCDDETTD